MSEVETKTAYEQFLEQAQEEVVHQETARDENFLRYRDIANDLFAIAKRESLPYLNNRFLIASALAIALGLTGHAILFLNIESSQASLNHTQDAARSDISNLAALNPDQRDSYTEQTKHQLQDNQIVLAQKAYVLQITLGIGTALMLVSAFFVCRRVAQKNTDKNIFACATAATHNFLLWKLRSPSNATTYSIFVDFDQLESDDIDVDQLKRMFSNAHYSWNRRGMFDFALMAIVALPVLFVPTFGLGLYFWMTGFAFTIAILQHLRFVGPYDCLNHLPAPLNAPYPQNQMPKSDGQDGYPG